MPKDDYVQQRAGAARWIYDRKDRPMWWRWSVLTKHNTDPETLALPDTVAWNVFTDLAKRDLLVPCMGDDGFEAFKLNLGPNDAWKAIMHPPGFLAQYIVRPAWFLFKTWFRLILWLLSIIITAAVTAAITQAITDRAAQ